MTKDVLKMIKDTYKNILSERILKANELYENIWEDVLNYYSEDNSPENIIEIDISSYIDEDNKELNDLLFAMLRQDGFKEGEYDIFSIPASVITCLANQQKEIQQLRLKNHL